MTSIYIERETERQRDRERGREKLYLKVFKQRKQLIWNVKFHAELSP